MRIIWTALPLILSLGTAAPACAEPEPLPLPDIARDPLAGILIQPFEIDRSNRLGVEVEINGEGPFYFLVDTGSERTVITEELARLLDLEAGPRLNLATLAGRHVAPSFKVANLSTDAITIRDLEAPALQRRNLGAQGLIGIDALTDRLVVIDFRAGNIRISRRDDVAAAAGITTA